MQTYRSNSPKDTRFLAKTLAKRLGGSGVILLRGELGSGKTQFVKFLAAAYGIKQHITSPTFVLHKTYFFTRLGKKHSFEHFDFYRLGENEKGLNLGLEDVLSLKDNIIAIEWPEKISKLKSINAIRIHFSYGKTAQERTININGTDRLPTPRRAKKKI